jgi:FecR protein
MFERRKTIGSLLGLGLSVVCGGSGALAQDAAWHVGKSSGEVWLTGTGVQQVSLGGDTVLKPGDTIRTGRTGRVLLVRGEETILISPNSVIGIPAAPKDGLSTTIIQQAGEILLEVEKRNVEHFEVETPFFAAVVKGTQFRVSVDKSDSHVDVLRGQVEVADFKSGQYAMVLPGQVAKVVSRSVGGLLLSGAGALSPILKGAPRTPAVKLVPVPKDGLTAPTDVPKTQQIRLASLIGASPAPFAAPASPPPSSPASFNPPPRNEPPGPAPFAPVQVPRDAAADQPVHLALGLGFGLGEGRASAPEDTPRSSGLSSDFLSWGKGNGSDGAGPWDRRTYRNVDIAHDLELAFAIGAVVTLAVAISRRRRKRAPA